MINIQKIKGSYKDLLCGHSAHSRMDEGWQQRKFSTCCDSLSLAVYSIYQLGAGRTLPFHKQQYEPGEQRLTSTEERNTIMIINCLSE